MVTVHNICFNDYDDDAKYIYIPKQHLLTGGRGIRYFVPRKLIRYMKLW